MAAKILLVEDDNNLREIYEARLQAEGYTIVSAPDGEAALVVAKAEKPDLIISDVMMPRISGFEMLDILRNTEELKDIKVIMLTALGQAEDKTRANSLGADRYLVKSQVTLEDIVKAAHMLIDGTDGTVTVPAPSEEATLPSLTPITPQSSPVQAPAASAAVTPPSPAESSTSPQVPSEPAATPTNTTQPIPSAPPVSTSPPITIPTPSSEPTPVVTPPSTDTLSIPLPTESHSSPTEEISVANPDKDTVPPATDLPTTTAQEENETVKSQINNFANNLPTEPAPKASDNETADKDDTVLSNAVEDLTSNTPPSDSTSSTTEATKSQDQLVNPKSLFTPTTPTSEPNEDDSSNSMGTNNVVIANKKVIEPIKSDPKPGLDELLAAEEAKSIINPVAVTDETTTNSTPIVQNSPSPGSTFSPNSS